MPHPGERARRRLLLSLHQARAGTTLCISSGARTTFRCPAGSPLARMDCEHPAASGIAQIPVPAWHSPKYSPSSAPEHLPKPQEVLEPGVALCAGAQVFSTSKTRPRQWVLMPCFLTQTVLPQEEDNPATFKMQTTSKLSSGTETLLNAIPGHNNSGIGRQSERYSLRCQQKKKWKIMQSMERIHVPKTRGQPDWYWFQLFIC